MEGPGLSPLMALRRPVPGITVPAPASYMIADAGPHPNPGKAADGRRLHRLALNLEAAPVVVRIFDEFIAGRGFYAIAEGLTRDGIPSPSAHDRARNSHRSGLAWNKFAIRTILTNPRYTGHQVWNKQRKDEVLINVEDVALGHVTKLRWNDSGKWIWSEKIVHPPIIDRDSFDQVQVMVAGRATKHAEHKPHRARHPYALHGCVWCGICGRRMQSHWAHDTPYYRCRFAAEYALANHVQHPLSVSLREGVVLGEVERWLAREFAPQGLHETITNLEAAQVAESAAREHGHEEVRLKIAECDRKLAQYRAALDAGASPATVAAWIAETEAQKAGYLAAKRSNGGAARQRTSKAETKAIVDGLTELARILASANPEDKSEIFRQLGLRLIYHPEREIVEAQIQPAQYGLFEGVRELSYLPGPIRRVWTIRPRATGNSK
jgi:site-specific DNA recombinase